LNPDLRRLRNAIGSATAGMGTEDLARHTEGKWSTAEILEHLCRSYTGTIKAFERCLQKGKPLARSSTFKDRIRTVVVTRLNYMPKGRTAPEPTMPKGMPPEQVMENIGPAILAMDAVIEQCRYRFGKTVKVLDHPILGPLNTQEWCRFHWVHGNHHVKQILKLRKQAPGAGR